MNKKQPGEITKRIFKMRNFLLITLTFIFSTQFAFAQNFASQMQLDIEAQMRSSKQSVEVTRYDLVKPLNLMTGLSTNFWEKERLFLLDGSLSMKTLSDSKDKLLILHFWAPWCAPCIAKFPLMDSLQKKYSKELSFVLVNGTSDDNKFATIEMAFNRQKKDNPQFSLPSIIEDVTLKWLFPQRTIGAYIWILEGNVIAMTFSDLINENSIQSVLKEREKKVAEQKRKAELKKVSKTEILEN